MKKLLALFLAALMLLSMFAFTACKDDPIDDSKLPDDGNTDDKDDDGNSDDERPDYEITISDAPLEIPEDAKEICDGHTFVIDVPTPWGTDRFVREALNDEPINDSIYNMNLAVEDTLGVTIDTIMQRSTGTQAAAFIDDVLSGNHTFDVMAMHNMSACASLVLADAILPFDYLEYCDLDKPWWDKGFSEASSFYGNNLFAVSSSCYALYLNTNVILFNKDLADEHDLPDLYELVRKGEWTIDKMIQLTKNFSQDLNNDGIYDYNDQLAIISDDKPHIESFRFGARQATVERGEGDEPTILVDSLRMTQIIERVNTLLNTGRRGYIYPISLREFGEDTYTQAFAEGRVLFNVCYVDTATKLRDYDINFGILPTPKLDLDQERYGAHADAWHLAYAVPADSPNPERTSIILETMAYYSYHYTYPAIIQKSVYGTGTRDTESIEMLEKYIYPNIFHDFGYIYDGLGKGYGTMLQHLIQKGSTDSASYIAEKRNTVETHFDDLYEAVQNNYGG